MEVVQTVIPGEASESDDEEVANITRPRAQIREKVDSRTNQATVVCGEASESEDEEEEGTEVKTNENIPPLKVNIEGKGDRSDITGGDITPTSPAPQIPQDKPYYDSLLHRKLRDRNVALRRHLVDAVHQGYISASKDLHNTSMHLHKSQSSVMDASHSLKLLTNDLFYLEDKMDIITNCPILPDICIPQK